jgi:tRNA-binding EMAP/Myf-like protein
MQVKAAKKANHQVNFVRISSILPHTNADKLELIPIGEYQIVVQKGSFKVGDLAVYIQPDSVVPQTDAFRFIWEPYVTPGATEPVSERRRRITVRKFRGEWSEGLLMHTNEFPGLTVIDVPTVATGLPFDFDVSEMLGITHYDPDIALESTSGDTIPGPHKNHKPHTWKGWFYWVMDKLGFGFKTQGSNMGVDFHIPTYDVDALKNFPRTFTEGEQVNITEKIHGSNARYTFRDGVMYVGSRTLWKAPKSNCIWRKVLVQVPWVEDFCRQHPGYVVYGEVVPTQKGFRYGCEDGEVKFFMFDILSDEGYWLSNSEVYSIFMISEENLDSISVPYVYRGPYHNDTVRLLASGPSMVEGADHVREGIVIKPMVERSVRGLGRVSLKVVSNEFLLKDSKVAA